MLISKRLEDNIKEIQTRKGISQGDICREFDMGRGCMNNIEFKRNPALTRIEKNTQALGVASDELLK